MPGARQPQSTGTQLNHVTATGAAGPTTNPGPLGTAPAEVPVLSSMTSGPRLLLAGKEAMAAVATILPQSHPLVVPSPLGPVELRPGTIWAGRKMLLYAAPLYVWYTIDDRLYEWNTPAFVRDEWLTAIAKGAATAEWLVVVAEVEFALLTGIFVPWYILLALSCAKLGILYLTHRQLFNDAFKYGPDVLEKLLALKSSHPQLFHKLLVQAGKDVLVNMPKGITAEDVAFFLGRLIHAAAEAGAELTLGMLVKMTLKIAGLVTLVHLPNFAAHGVEAAAKARAEELKKQLEDAGFTVTKGEAEAILREALSQPDTKDKLKALEDACQKLAPSMETLGKLLTGTPP